MTPDRLSELRAIADKATPGPWDGHGVLVWSSDHGPAAADPIAQVSHAHLNCAEYIAAFDPTTVRELLDEIDRLRGDR